MIGTLFTGVRNIRGPIAAGYIWLLALYLTVAPFLRHPRATRGTVADLDALLRSVPPTALIAASVFVAFLLGSASQDLTAWMVRQATSLARRMARKLQPRSGRAEPKEKLSAPATDARIRRLRSYVSHLLSEWSGYRAAIMSLKGWRVTEQVCDEHVRRVNALFKRHGVTRRQVRNRIAEDSWLAPRDPVYMLLEIARASSPDPAGADADEPEPGAVIAQEVISGLDVVKDRLASSAPQRHFIIDQIEAESDIRLAIVAPLIMLTGVLALRAPGWWLVALVAPAIFWHQGVHRRKERGDMIADALASGLTTAPYLEQLMSAAKKMAADIQPDGSSELAAPRPETP